MPHVVPFAWRRMDHPSANPARPALHAPQELAPEVYDELRRLAAFYLNHERRDHTLQPTALVHEAYLKLAGQTNIAWDDAMQFRAIAAHAMRQILVDHARRRKTDKRGGDRLRVTFDDGVAAEQERDIDLVALDEAMQGLSRLDERKCRVVELRFFGGLTCDQAARELRISPKTAEADWYMARAWLRSQLTKTT